MICGKTKFEGVENGSQPPSEKEKNMDVQDRVKATREAGMVIRCHTVPYHGTYNVGIHSYNALSLLLLLYPTNPSVELIKGILWHDAAERWVGDIPATAKWKSVELKSSCEDLENAYMHEYGLWQTLTAIEHQWLHAVDKIELWLWAKEQLEMGNQNIQGYIDRLDTWFTENYHKLPEPCQDFVANYNWTRLGD